MKHLLDVVSSPLPFYLDDVSSVILFAVGILALGCVIALFVFKRKK